MPARRALLTGWASFLHGEATAGDLLALRTVADWLTSAGWTVDTALSRGLTDAGVDLEAARPEDYTLLVFACGPAHGWQVEELHTRFAAVRRIAVGVSVVDPGSRAVRGFAAVLARDAVGDASTVDLAAGAPTESPLVAGVTLANPQPEYGDRQRHDAVHGVLTEWLAVRPIAVTRIETRVSAAEWQLGRSADQVVRLFARVDVVITSRMHGLVLALGQGVPVIAIDPIAGGAKVSAQAGAWEWPALLNAGSVSTDALDDWWAWCSTPGARAAVTRSRNVASAAVERLRHRFTALADGPDTLS